MRFVKLYFSLQGRISRSAFWFKILIPLFFYMVSIAFLIAVVFEPSTFGRQVGEYFLMVCLPHSIAIWSGIAAGVKRLHDRGKSGRAILITVIPVIGAIWYFFILGFAKGTKGENQFGTDPAAT